MDLQTQLKELRHLEYLLVSKDVVIRERDKITKNYEKGLENASKTGVPTAPVQPNAPRIPTKPKHIEVDTSVNPALYFFGIGVYVKAALKKKKKDAEEKNQQMDAEYAEKMAKYEKDYAKWQEDLKVYTDAYAKWQVAVKKKTDGNVEKYKKENTGMLAQVKKLEAELADLEKGIAASTILSSEKDKNLDIVIFLIQKLDSGRADSIMMALNMYDMEKRQEAQHQARMQAEAFDRRMEADRRKQWEAKQEWEQWSHNRQMESYAKETRDYERQQAKDLEEIRKAADKLGR